MSEPMMLGSDRNALLSFCYATLFAFWITSFFVFIPVWISVLSQTFCMIYIGSCHSLAQLNKKLSKSKSDEAKDEGEQPMTAKDAAWFPIYGSFMLFSLYIAFKYFDKDAVNLLLSVYFSLIGVVTLAGLFDKGLFSSLMGTDSKSPRYGYEATIPYLGELGGKFTVSEWVSALPALALAATYFKTKHWMLNNLLGIAFSVNGIEAISIGSYKVGAILLGGLFFYDIFWVFGTSVMVSVAKGVDGPIKILFPREAENDEEGDGPFYSMLGLGDIVIPGIFLALILRFDAMRAISKMEQEIQKVSVRTTFPVPTFMPTMIAYSLGLGCTLFVMYYFDAAQPALLYLVPACLLSSMSMATMGGYAKELLAYSEEDEEDTTEQAKETKTD